MARITLTIDEVVIHMETGRGRSAYESYLRTTTDDPPLSEAEWAQPGAGTLDLANHYGTMNQTTVVIDGGLL